MRVLTFDTETTGLLNLRLPASHSSQPHIVQLAALLQDENQNTIGSFSFIVNPGIEVPKQAASVHGITTERARALGVNPRLAMDAFEQMLRCSDLAIAHNSKFNIGIMATACHRSGIEPKWTWPRTFCTMTAAAPIVNIPPTARMLAAGITKPKSPTLDECIMHFFGERLEGAHDAMIDVQACARLYWHLKGIGIAE